MKYILALILVGCGGPGVAEQDQQPEQQQPHYAGDYLGHYLQAFPDGERIYETWTAVQHFDLVGNVLSTTMNNCVVSFTQTKQESEAPAVYMYSSAECHGSNMFDGGQLTITSAGKVTAHVSWSSSNVDGSRTAVVDTFDGTKRR